MTNYIFNDPLTNQGIHLRTLGLLKFLLDDAKDLKMHRFQLLKIYKQTQSDNLTKDEAKKHLSKVELVLNMYRQLLKLAMDYQTKFENNEISKPSLEAIFHLEQQADTFHLMHSKTVNSYIHFILKHLKSL